MYYDYDIDGEEYPYIKCPKYGIKYYININEPDVELFGDGIGFLVLYFVFGILLAWGL